MAGHSTSIVLGAAGAAAFLTLIALLSDHGWRNPEAGAATAPRDGMQRQVASLSKTVAELEARLAMRESTNRLGVGAPTSPAVLQAQTVAGSQESAPREDPDWEEADRERMQSQRRAQADAWYRDQLSVLEGSFVSQGADPAWEAESQDRILAAFEEVEGQLDLVSLACGTAMCRIDARRNSDGAALPVDQLLHGSLGWEGQSMAKVDEATGEVTVYLMREGVQMPLAEPRSL